jgi:hypothetical protein
VNLKQKAFEIVGHSILPIHDEITAEVRTAAWADWWGSLKKGDIARHDTTGEIVEIMYVDPGFTFLARIRPVGTKGEGRGVPSIDLQPVSSLEALAEVAE